MSTRSSNFNWIPALFILGYHAVLLVGLPLYFIYHTPSWGMLATGTILMYITGLSVTAGYHRLYSHPTYKTSPIVESVILFFGTMATQGSAIRWSFEHRHHHAFIDTDQDPYSIKKGFWYAHFLWLLEKPKEIDNKVVADLVRNPLLRFQHRFYGILMLATNLLAFLAAGWYFNDYLGSFLFVWMVRLFFLHHFTWFINSLAHTWGSRHFCKEHSAVDNYMISLLTFGEGYHNYHHTFANDYRNGIRWYHFDPTKWLIWSLSKCGLAHQLKRVQRFQIEEKIIKERKLQLLEQISASTHIEKSEWENKINSLTDNILTKLNQLKELKRSFNQLKKSDGVKKESLKDLKVQIKTVDLSLKKEYKLTEAFSRYVDTVS